MNGHRRLEKHEQADTVDLLRKIGADVYVLGTRRPRGRACPSCGAFVAETQGTRQTTGLPDLVVFLPRRTMNGKGTRPILFVELKRDGGRASPSQIGFFQTCADSMALYVKGTAADVLRWLADRGYVRP